VLGSWDLEGARGNLCCLKSSPPPRVCVLFGLDLVLLWNSSFSNPRKHNITLVNIERIDPHSSHLLADYSTCDRELVLRPTPLISKSVFSISTVRLVLFDCQFVRLFSGKRHSIPKQSSPAKSNQQPSNTPSAKSRNSCQRAHCESTSVPSA
jgi:hypothetical protein